MVFFGTIEMHELPETGFVKLRQIIGQDAVTEEQAAQNRERGKGPKRSRQGIPPVIPIKKSSWWAGCKSGRYPKPIKIGNGGGTFWRAADIRALIASAAG